MVLKKKESRKKTEKHLEIGGFFEFPECDCGNEKHSAYNYLGNGVNNILFFGDGRQAIKSVLLSVEDVKRKTCYLPSYLCRSILQPFEELGLRVKFYDFRSPLGRARRKNGSLVFIVDYFGTENVSEDEINDYLLNGCIVVLDATHSLLDKKRLMINGKNLYIIASLRKIFPIPDGGVLYWSNDKIQPRKAVLPAANLMVEAIKSKKIYLNNTSNPSAKIKNRFLRIYQKNETDKDRHSIILRKMSGVSFEILRNINILNIIRKRKRNLKFFYDNLLDKNLFLFDFNEFKSPFILPLIFNNSEEREAVRKLMIENNIYPPIHWDLKKMISEKYSFEHRLSKRILSMPIDQRYGKDNLRRVADILNKKFLWRK